MAELAVKRGKCGPKQKAVWRKSNRGKADKYRDFDAIEIRQKSGLVTLYKDGYSRTWEYRKFKRLKRKELEEFFLAIGYEVINRTDAVLTLKRDKSERVAAIRRQAMERRKAASVLPRKFPEIEPYKRGQKSAEKPNPSL